MLFAFLLLVLSVINTGPTWCFAKAKQIPLQRFQAPRMGITEILLPPTLESRENAPVENAAQFIKVRTFRVA